MIWEFRLRNGIRGVSTKHVSAGDLASAQEKAQAYVDAIPGALYIPNSCEPWLITVAGESPIVEADLLGDGTPGKPGNAEQKQRLAKQALERKAGTGLGSTPRPESGEPVDNGRIGA